MIVTEHQIPIIRYEVRFHSVPAAEAFAEEMRKREQDGGDVWRVSCAYTVVTFHMNERKGSNICQEFEARWIQQTAAESAQ